MSKKTTTTPPSAASDEPMLPVVTEMPPAVDEAVETSAAIVPPPTRKAHPMSTPAVAGPSVEELVEVGMAACGETSAAGTAARRAMLEGVAAMILAAR